MSFKSKYKGQEVDNLLDKIKGYKDPSTYLTKEEAKKDYQPKVEGKGLSTEDFTTALKNKLESLSNFDSSAIESSISNIQNQINTLVSGDASSAIESFNEIISFLEGIEDSDNLDSIIASIEQQISKKADTASLSEVATSGDYNDLENKPLIPNLKGYATEAYVNGIVGDIDSILDSIINT